SDPGRCVRAPRSPGAGEADPGCRGRRKGHDVAGESGSERSRARAAFRPIHEEEWMRVFGVVLVVLGLLALVYGGISYTQREKGIDLGPIQAPTTEKRQIPISPIAGGLAVLAGAVMNMAGGRRATA